VTSLETGANAPSQPDPPTVGAVDDSVVVVPPTTSPRPIVTIPGVGFEFDTADLAPSAIAILESVLGDLLPAQRVEITGHTDSSGTTAHNESLAVARAEAVARWLEAQGVPKGRIRVAGAGSSRPIADNDDERGRAANRRVEISAE
jgi:outer membrane protein OmpA-like peptidoglycan-associated protein